MEYSFKNYKMSTIYLYHSLIEYIRLGTGINLNFSSFFPKKTKYIGGCRALIPDMREERNGDIPDKFRGYVDIFLKKMESLYGADRPDNLNNLYRNISSLKISGVVFQLDDLLKIGEKIGISRSTKNDEVIRYSQRFSGIYYASNNTVLINLAKDSRLIDLFHELTHVASTDRSNLNNIRTGFEFKVNGKTVFGRKLLEDYTNWFCLKNFREYGFDYPVTPGIVICNLLEQIVGQEEMESIFLKVQSQKLVAELAKYNTNGLGFGNPEGDAIATLMSIENLNKPDTAWGKRRRKYTVYSMCLEMFLTKQLSIYGRLDMIPSTNIQRFLNSIPDEYGFDKNEFLRNAYQNINFRFPNIGHQMTA